MTLFGWDSSDYDWARGSMNLEAAKRDGITWFTHKATEGTSTKHVHLADAMNRGRDAGLEFLGAYHVVRTGNVSAQVDYFLNYVDQRVPWWRDFPGFFLQSDLEKWPYDQVSAATGKAFASALVAAQPRKVLTYASRGQYGDSLAGIVTPLWNAAYGGNPAIHYPDAYPGDNGSGWRAYSGQTPVMWQYGSQTRIGTQPTCDANAFRGSLADLRALLGVPEGSDDDVEIFYRAENGAVGLIAGNTYRGFATMDALAKNLKLRGKTTKDLVPIALADLPLYGVDVSQGPTIELSDEQLAELAKDVAGAIDVPTAAEVADAVVDEEAARLKD